VHDTSSGGIRLRRVHRDAVQDASRLAGMITKCKLVITICD
jgi:hypothetical protein